MILAVMLAAALPQPVAAAERAFAAQAQREGQWAAFRANATGDAIMLAPKVVNAHLFLAGRKEPGGAVMWWPARTVTSCDGTLALSTGPFRGPDGAAGGRYISLWRRQGDGGWKWVYDGGVADGSAMAAGDRVIATRASCRRPRVNAPDAGALAGGASDDGSLRWRLDAAGDRHRLRVLAWSATGIRIEEDVLVG